jgi:hypothetical protein
MIFECMDCKKEDLCLDCVADVTSSKTGRFYKHIP